MNIEKIEKRFEKELNILREEIESGILFFYAYLTLQKELSKKDVIRALNKTPRFWRTVLASLQTSFFIVLGRIFGNGKHNVYTLLKVAQENKEIFTKSALRKRKMRISNNYQEWIDGYIEKAYEPTDKDFQRLNKLVDKYRDIYKTKYEIIRNKIFAHKVLSEDSAIRAVFDKTDIHELQKIFVFLLKLHEALWQLFHNGRKPVLRQHPYSIAVLLKHIRKSSDGNSIHYLIVKDTLSLLEIIKRGA